MAQPATIAIAARNAEHTIQRAVRSALAQRDYPILLVDDHSSDDTVSLAQAVGGTRLDVVRPLEHRTLGYARHTGLLAVRTPVIVWLDADDELLPGRIDRLVRALEGADIAADGTEVVDGASGRHVAVAPIPSFLRRTAIPARLFERNYLPGPGVVGMRADVARDLGYDVELHGSEDVDLLLRAVASRRRFALLPDIGYRVFTYPQSHSRHLARQRRMYRASLAKHTYAQVQAFYREAGHDERATAWGAASMATFRGDYAQALAFVDEAAAFARADPMEIAEADGPWPYPEAWRVAFHRGTLQLLLDRPVEAVASLNEAEQFLPSAEGANNLGVAVARLGARQAARANFTLALSRLPDFADARINMDAAHPDRITSHPLRTHPARMDYACA